MPRNELSCGCSGPVVLYLFVGRRRIGAVCEICARHTPTLRSFLAAASFLYDWRHLTFAYDQAAAITPSFRAYLNCIIDQEGRGAMWRNEDRAAFAVRWAARPLPGESPARPTSTTYESVGGR